MQMLEERRCPSCGSNWELLERDLSSALEIIYWPGGGFFQGKSDARIRAETIIDKCDECRRHFYGGLLNSAKVPYDP